jgi:hypothetical protein
MQIARFENGGFALHRVELFGYKGRFSAWYSATGELLDCEQITFSSPNGRKAPKGAKPGLARLGPIYREAVA